MAAICLSNRPLYLQVRDAVAERISTGAWKTGIAIPNEGDLAREFGVSVGTVRKALGLLEGQHVLTRQQGRGTFVNDRGSDAAANRFQTIRGIDGKPVNDEVKFAEIVESVAGDPERDRLRLGKHDPVYRIRRVRLRHDRPFMVEEVTLPAALFPGLAVNNGSSLGITRLAQNYGLLLGKAQERLTIASAAPAVAAALGVATAAPVMVLDRVMLTIEGRPIEWRVGHCRLDDDHYFAEMR
jgi:GntR family transcriptional regulator